MHHTFFARFSQKQFQRLAHLLGEKHGRRHALKRQTPLSKSQYNVRTYFHNLRRHGGIDIRGKLELKISPSLHVNRFQVPKQPPRMTRPHGAKLARRPVVSTIPRVIINSSRNNIFQFRNVFVRGGEQTMISIPSKLILLKRPQGHVLLTPLVLLVRAATILRLPPGVERRRHGGAFPVSERSVGIVHVSGVDGDRRAEGREAVVERYFDAFVARIVVDGHVVDGVAVNVDYLQEVLSRRGYVVCSSFFYDLFAVGAFYFLTFRFPVDHGKGFSR
mmetsp:Transcript_20228/g.25009  ORF Transcript_20228/g.25009 Transcript_20228/m.25009 type:complete len:275 (+) Transcript_20228:177-1001(+)